MNTFDPESIAQRLFTDLRKQGFNLGMAEYLDAIAVLRSDLAPADLDALQSLLELLWCHSLAEQSQFGLIWQEMVKLSQPSPIDRREQPFKEEEPTKTPEFRSDSILPQPQDSLPLPVSEQSDLVPLPVRLPFLPAETGEASDLRLYFPVTRRSLSYLWRYLRRPLADGPADVLDVETTIQQVVRRGFYLAPVYRRREVNHAHLLLLIDQEGSMTPFHRFTRDLVETALEDSSIETVNVYYFHNVPTTYLYTNAHLTATIPRDRVLASCDKDTSVLIVSDAGAARGYRRMERIRATTEFLVNLKQQTSLVSWLNPMPADRWESTSAEIIAYLVRMQEMDDDGMSQAIDIVRGQPLPPTHPI